MSPSPQQLQAEPQFLARGAGRAEHRNALEKELRGIERHELAGQLPDQHPASAPRQRASRRREHRRADGIEHAVDALAIGQRLHVAGEIAAARRRAPPHRRPSSRNASTFAGEVVCAITQPPARLASCTPCMPRPPPAPVTSTVSPGAMRPTARTACSMVPIAHAAIAACVQRYVVGNRAPHCPLRPRRTPRIRHSAGYLRGRPARHTAARVRCDRSGIGHRHTRAGWWRRDRRRRTRFTVSPTATTVPAIS